MARAGRFLTVDLGAESGRAVLGAIENGKLTLMDQHRFLNQPQWILGRFHWDTVRLFADIKAGIVAAHKNHGNIDGIGIDTWGVDFALLDSRDECLGLPYHYRDHRTDGVMEKAFEIISTEKIYQSTGIQFMQLNTLFQLLALKFDNSPFLDQAKSLLFTPDLFHFWLTGIKVNEFSIASTSQCFNPRTGTWATDILSGFGLPTDIFAPIVPPGTQIGELHASVQKDLGVGAIPVIVPACHDTGSAVAAVPVQQQKGWAYISCGTWSLVGVESPVPVINDLTYQYNFTNEGGVNGTYRLLRNVMGLWLLQQARSAWEKAGHTYNYAELAELAASATPFRSLVDPDSPSFFNPSNMVEAIQNFCQHTEQPVPQTPDEIVRTILDSLALKYWWVIERLEEITGEKLTTIHVIGGGCRNRELCQATANATGRRVIAGPIEATAAGNVIVQAVSAGVIENLEAGRKIISESFEMEEYVPIRHEEWLEPRKRFLDLIQ